MTTPPVISASNLTNFLKCRTRAFLIFSFFISLFSGLYYSIYSLFSEANHFDNFEEIILQVILVALLGLILTFLSMFPILVLFYLIQVALINIRFPFSIIITIGLALGMLFDYFTSNLAPWYDNFEARNLRWSGQSTFAYGVRTEPTFADIVGYALWASGALGSMVIWWQRKPKDEDQ